MLTERRLLPDAVPPPMMMIMLTIPVISVSPSLPVDTQGAACSSAPRCHLRVSLGLHSGLSSAAGLCVLYFMKSHTSFQLGPLRVQNCALLGICSTAQSCTQCIRTLYLKFSQLQSDQSSIFFSYWEHVIELCLCNCIYSWPLTNMGMRAVNPKPKILM